jgi:hypothetical protein
LYRFVQYLLPSLLLIIIGFELVSCKKDKFITDPKANISFSSDSILFDTVFTTIGSSTRNIRVINRNSQKIKISSITLAKGNSSSFIINVDGAKGTYFEDIELAAHDSIFIFVQVHVNPTNLNSPLIITDEIDFTVNGNASKVNLEAWGQDAYYHYPTDAIKFSNGTYLPYSLISKNPNCDTTWNNDKPHVVYGWLVVDSKQKLTLNGGVRMYFAQKAGLWVYQQGTLKVKGTLGNEVLFTQARRDPEYADEPGQWDRIWINEGSVDNEINYAIIRNGYIGIQAEVLEDTLNKYPNRLKLTNTKIYNMSQWGLYTYAFNVNGYNNVISNCQEYSVNLTTGGNYTFLHCTFANFWLREKTRDLPTLRVSNHIDNTVLPLDTCYFGNCIIDGILTNELDLDIKSSTTSPPTYFFSSCVLKTTINTSDATKFNGNLTNNQGNYIDPQKYDFNLKSTSQAGPLTGTNAATDAGKVPVDINGAARTSTIWAGAYIKP